MEKERIVKNAQKLSVDVNSDQMLRRAFALLKVDKKNVKRKILFLLLTGAWAWMLAKNEKTIELTETTIELLNTVILAIFGITFTGYSLFQAMIADDLLMLLIEVGSTDDQGASSKLEETNIYFIKVMLLQFIIIVIDLILRIFLNLIPEEWGLLNSKTLNEGICFIGLLALLWLNMETVWEVKSFIFNIFQVCNLHDLSRILDILKKDKW